MKKNLQKMQKKKNVESPEDTEKTDENVVRKKKKLMIM